MANVTEFCKLIESQREALLYPADDDDDDEHGDRSVDGSSPAVGVQQQHWAMGQQCQPSSSSALLADDEVEELHGTVVLGHNGQFYVELSTTTHLDDHIELEQFENVFVTVNASDGAQTLVFDDTDRHGRIIDDRTEQRRRQPTPIAANESTTQQQSTSAEQQQPQGRHGWRKRMAMAQTGPSSSFVQAQPADHYCSDDVVVSVDGDSANGTNDDTGGTELLQQQQYLLSSSTAMLDDVDVAQEEVVVECDEDTIEGEYGFKHRRSRVFGCCRCFECGQTFVNMARLERHLSVHQQYGLYLCPLCGKTYKYEYNLFFHWRKTCRDMNELLSQDERRAIEINALRQLVEEIAQKKLAIGPLELAPPPTVPLRRLPPPILRQNVQQKQQQHKTLADKTLACKLTVVNMFGDKLATCSLCELSVYRNHLATHRAVHRDERPVDARGVGGAFFCDLCALMFRTRRNLIRHWRTGCSTIHANLPPNSDIAMDDTRLKQMVVDLLKKLTHTESGVGDANFDDEQLDQQEGQASFPTITTASSSAMFNTDHHHHQQQQQQQQQNPSAQSSPHNQQLDEEWARAEGIFFADDFFDDDIASTAADEGNGDDVAHNGGGDGHGDGGSLLLFTEDGRLVNMAQHQQQRQQRWHCVQRRTAPVAVVVPTQHYHQQYNHYQHGVQAVRAMDEGGDGDDLQCIQYATQSVQCSECYRSFSSVQRLEKHMAGTHCSFGTHHCLLCGSRFKFEYNLLFHYRQVCAYTLKLISDEQRQQLEAVDLKKAVRRLSAASASSLHVSALPHHHHHHSSSGIVPSSMPTTMMMPCSASGSSAAMQQQHHHHQSALSSTSSNDGTPPPLASSSSVLSMMMRRRTACSSPPPSASSSSPHIVIAAASAAGGGHDDAFGAAAAMSPTASAALSSALLSSSARPELGDSVIRRQMMKKIIQKHRSHQHGTSSATASSRLSLPQQLLQHSVRPDLPDGTQCPICSIVFYGLKVLVRHLRAAHPNESSVWERTLSALGSSDGVGAVGRALSSASFTTTKLCPSRVSAQQRRRKTLHEENEEQPPQLELCCLPDTSSQRRHNAKRAKRSAALSQTNSTTQM